MVQTKVMTFTYDAPWEVVVLSYEDKFWNVPNEQFPELLECSFSDYRVKVTMETYEVWSDLIISPP